MYVPACCQIGLNLEVGTIAIEIEIEIAIEIAKRFVPFADVLASHS